MVEAVQRKFTKRLRGMSNLDYKERLALLDAETLDLRRLKNDLITVYTILFGLLTIDFNDNFVFKQNGATLGSSGHNYCRVESNGRVVARCNYFAVRIITPWNSLPAETIKCNSLASFKRTLNSIDTSSFLRVKLFLINLGYN